MQGPCTWQGPKGPNPMALRVAMEGFTPAMLHLGIVGQETPQTVEFETDVSSADGKQGHGHI